MKLLVFVACEKAIVEEGTGMISLVSLLQAINVALPPEADPPPVGAIVPHKWSALTVWNFAKSITEAEIEQCTSLNDPDGEELMRSNISPVNPPIQIPDNPFSHVNSRLIDVFSGFPVWKAGTCHLVLRTRRIGNTEWEVVGEYPIEINFLTPSSSL